MRVTPEQLDALQEWVNLGMGQAAGMLNDLLDCHITLQVPSLKMLSPLELQQELEDHLGHQPVSAVRMQFCGTLSGNAHLVFPIESATKLAAVLTREQGDLPDWSRVKAGTLSEVGNIVLNGVMGAISNLLRQQLQFSIPVYLEDTAMNLLSGNDRENEPITLLAYTHFSSHPLLIQGDSLLVFKVDSFHTLLDTLELASTS